MTMIENIKETSSILNISEKNALTLEFIYLKTMASLIKNRKYEALFHIAALHSNGQINKATKDKLLRCL